MKFTVDYEHIFFDRCTVDKRKEALYILKKVFEESGIDLKEENSVFEADTEDYEKHVLTETLFDIIKTEFFVKCREAETVLPDERKDENTIVDYIRKNYLYDTLTVEEICLNAGFSRREADRCMKNGYNMTVSEYLRNLRVEKSSVLLKEGHTVAECASLCGFGSVKSMQRAFKSVLGQTPGEYREGPSLDSECGK